MLLLLETKIDTSEKLPVYSTKQEADYIQASIDYISPKSPKIK